MTEDLNDIPLLFGPQTGKSLRKLYPEIAAEPAFKELKDDELLFVWYISNQSSPVDPNWLDEIRYKQAAIAAFPANPQKRNQYSAKDIPEHVAIAMEKMETYSPRARDVAARIIQQSFHNLLEMSNVDVEKDFLYTDKEGSTLTDWTARKQYVDSIKTTSEILPTLLKQLEEGFGMVKKNRKEESGVKSIDKYHQHKKNQS